MQVTDLKAILDYEHNEQWLAALNGPVKIYAQIYLQAPAE